MTRTTHVRQHTRSANLSDPHITYSTPTAGGFNPDKVAALESQIKALKARIKATPAHHHKRHAAHKKAHSRIMTKLKAELAKLKKVKHHKGRAALRDAKVGLKHFIKKEEEHATHWFKTRALPGAKKAGKKTLKWLGHEAHVGGKWAAKKTSEGFHNLGSWIKRKWQEHKAQKALKEEVGQTLETY